MKTTHLPLKAPGSLTGVAAALCALSLVFSPHDAWAQKKKRKKDTQAQTEKDDKKPSKDPKKTKKSQPSESSEASAGDAKSNGPPPEPTVVVARKPRPALSRISEALAQQLERAKPGSLVVAAPLVSDVSAPKGAALVVSIAAQLAGRRGQGTWALGTPAELDEARRLSRSEGGFIFIKTELSAGKLNVTADAYPISKSVWARVRNPEPGPIDHAFESAPIDAEVRSFLAPVPLVSVTAQRSKNFESDVVAMACGDLDDDGSLEVVSVSRRRVSTVRFVNGKVVPIQSRSWPELSPVHPTPLREPIGFATLAPRAAFEPSPAGANSSEWIEHTYVDVALTDRARALRLDSKLQTVASFSQMAIPEGEGTACVRNWGLVLTGAVGPCAPTDPIPRLATVGGQYDAIASAELVSPDGQAYTVWVGRERGVLELRDSLGNRAVIDTAGAQLAVGDLDQDGEPEIISSVDTLNPMEDAVIVRTWQRAAQAKDGKIKERFRMPAAAGVRALSICEPDENAGRTPFVVATADEIWVVR